MLQANLGYDIKEIGRSDLLKLIDLNNWNRKLKTASPENSIIPIFHYWNNFYREERNHIIAIDRFWRDQIMGILTYTSDKEKDAVTMITVGTVKKGRGIGTLLIEKLLSSHQAKIDTLIAEIYPDDPSYEMRWRNFLERKTREFGIRLEAITQE